MKPLVIEMLARCWEADDTRMFGGRRLVAAIGTPAGLPRWGPRGKALTSQRTPYSVARFAGFDFISGRSPSTEVLGYQTSATRTNWRSAALSTVSDSSKFPVNLTLAIYVVRNSW